MFVLLVTSKLIVETEVTIYFFEYRLQLLSYSFMGKVCLKTDTILKGYRYKVFVDQFPITDKMVDIHGVYSTHVELLQNMKKKVISLQ